MPRSSRTLYEGHRIRQLRTKLALSQATMATRLGISISYLSQIENGDRPITEVVLLNLARQFPLDWDDVHTDEAAVLLARAMAALSDPSMPQPHDEEAAMRRAVRHQPVLAKRLIAMHDALLRAQEQVRALDDRLDAGSASPASLPWEQVRDWFHAAQNYVDSIDRSAEEIGQELTGGQLARSLEHELQTRFSVQVKDVQTGGILREFDPAAGILFVDRTQPPETILFSLAHQFGKLSFEAEIAEITASSGILSNSGRALLSAGLANYAAGALIMPYRRFRSAAREVRHDVDQLRRIFGTSFEQTCHRLSTLQRPGALGIPFFFCRVDMAGNITKRHSATRLQFARFGGACPLWVVHEAVAIPDRILVQLAQTPDGVRYVSMAKGLVKPSGNYMRQPRRYAVALGCEECHADEFIYADGLRTGGRATPIGTSCRACLRDDCDQRAFPPAAVEISMDLNRRGVVPYSLGELSAV